MCLFYQKAKAVTFLSLYSLNGLSCILFKPADALIVSIRTKQKEGGEENALQVALETSKNAVLKGSMDVLVVILV